MLSLTTSLAATYKLFTSGHHQSWLGLWPEHVYAFDGTQTTNCTNDYKCRQVVPLSDAFELLMMTTFELKTKGEKAVTSFQDSFLFRATKCKDEHALLSYFDPKRFRCFGILNTIVGFVVVTIE